jgi:nitroreductase/FMN reductase [NAD(P)H]
MPDTDAATIKAALAERFGEEFPVDPALPGLATLAVMAHHRVRRSYRSDPVDPALLRLVIACALSAPTKSDLQQCDLLIVRDAGKRARIAALLPQLPWLPGAPEFLVFLADGRRLPMISRARGTPFPNDHLDLFFNAAVDSAIVLSAFVVAAEAAGLGCCPISVIRDHAAEVSAMLELPDKVIPVAGMCVGWPTEAGAISPRLSLSTTVHVDRFDDRDTMAGIDAYDRRRAALRPYRGQRDPARFGDAAFYGWSEDKARQYAVPARTGFGAFVRAKGFRLE